MGKWTHNYDLTQVLSDHSHHRQYLGDIMCKDELRREIYRAQLSLYAHVQCKNDEEVGEEAEEIFETVPAHMHSDHYFSCVGWRHSFELGDLVNPTTVPPTTEPPVTTAAPVTTNAPTTTLSPTTVAPTTSAPEIKKCICSTEILKERKPVTEVDFLFPEEAEYFDSSVPKCDSSSVDLCRDMCYQKVSKKYFVV